VTLHIAPNGNPTASQRKVVAEASEADRRWFLAHPERTHRIRRALRGETKTDPGLTPLVVVRQQRPGFRIRIAFGVRHVPEGEAPEEAARMLFERFVGGDTATAQSYGEIVSAVHEMETQP
jgi:hypothetical protein